MKRLYSLILIILVIGGLILADGIFSQGSGISITPLTFELTANPGDILTNKLKVSNPSDSIVSLKMEIEDFRPEGETGQVVVEAKEEMTYSLKRWVRTEPSEFTLESQEQKFVDFIIEVPENAEPGGKYGSILASTTGAVGEGFTGTAVAQKVGALILLTVSGEVTEDLIVKDFTAPSFLEYGPIQFSFRFENRGTVHLRPRGFVTIANWWGDKVVDIEFPQLNVMPASIRKIETSLQKKWLFGKYTATLVGGYGSSNIPFNPPVLTFWVFPWKLALLIFLCLLVIFIFLYKSRKRWKLALRILFKGEK